VPGWRKWADARDLKSLAERRTGSTPVPGMERIVNDDRATFHWPHRRFYSLPLDEPVPFASRSLWMKSSGDTRPPSTLVHPNFRHRSRSIPG
jgi:hypothetical protein